MLVCTSPGARQQPFIFILLTYSTLTPTRRAMGSRALWIARTISTRSNCLAMAERGGKSGARRRKNPTSGRGRGTAATSDQTGGAPSVQAEPSLLTPSVVVSSRTGSGGNGRPNNKSASGRSSGRGRSNKVHQSNNHHGKSKKKPGRPLRPVKAFASDFASMHAHCQAARYKVHRPGCTCSKMKDVRKRYQIVESGNADSDLDGLVVLPDVKSISSIYVCQETGLNNLISDPKSAELKLRAELFSAEDERGYDDQKCTSGHTPYKVSCAQCLLKDEPNGFVCVSSPSVKTVEFVRDLVLKKIRYMKEEEVPLHADHADHVLVVPRSVLWRYNTAKTRDQINKAKYSLEDTLSSQGLNESGDSKLELGHHLVSLLYQTSKDSDADTAYWLVMMQWSGTKWNIDLPGGKRHLGETSFEGATRECREEISLDIDMSWIHGEPRRSSRKADEGNLYYVLRPPSDLLMESLESNAFWKEDGFCKEPAVK